MLTLEELKKIPAGEVFAQGEIENSPAGIFMINQDIGDPLLWVAKKGHGYDDWCIYIHWKEAGINYVITNGDKVTSDKNIQKLVPCEPAVLELYRK